MSQELNQFLYDDHEVRVIEHEGMPWFVATDLARVLEYRDSANLVRGLDEEDARTHIVSTSAGRGHGARGTRGTCPPPAAGGRSRRAAPRPVRGAGSRWRPRKRRCPGPRARVHVFGRGPLAARLEGVPGLELHGAVDHSALRKAYADADVYISPVIHEAFGLSALEARAAGLVVVARAESGVSEFIADGHDGILVSSDEEMVAAVDRLRVCPDELERLSRACQEAPPYDWCTVRRQIESLYREAADRHASRSSERGHSTHG